MRRLPQWACYHTDLYGLDYAGLCYGIVGRAVGAPFAVLVAEELFASGCQLLLSVTSAGQIAPIQAPPDFIIIDRALRDEGTSYHYVPPGDYSAADKQLVRLAQQALAAADVSAKVGAAWTTDAPFRETREAIAAAQADGICAVEMEAAALYAFAAARRKQVLCLAHVTNQMGQVEGDFEKGAAEGAEESLRVISAISRVWWTTGGKASNLKNANAWNGRIARNRNGWPEPRRVRRIGRTPVGSLIPAITAHVGSCGGCCSQPPRSAHAGAAADARSAPLR